MTYAVDLHVDTLLRLLERGGDFEDERPDLHVDPVRLRAGDVRLLLCACFTTENHPEPGRNVQRMLDLAASLDESPERPFRLVKSWSDYEALGDGETGMLLTIENARSLEGDPERLGSWWEAGVRIVGLTWNAANELAHGVGEPSGGLTTLGRTVVSRVGEQGMAIDLSHLAPAGVEEVLETGVPILATHSNAASVHPHPRNLTDSQIEAIATAGGIIGLNFYPPFLAEGEATVDDIARHARHMADLVGPERIAIGTDLDGISAFPRGFSDYGDLTGVEAALAVVGFDTGEREAIFHGNFEHWWRSLGSR